MAQGINFLKPKPVGDFRFYYRARLFKVASLILLIAGCLVLAATIALSLNLAQTEKTVAAQTQIKKERIAGLKKVESLQTILEQRLAALVAFKQKDLINEAKVVDEVLKATLADVAVSEISLDEKKLVVVEGSAANSATLGAFLDRLSSPESLFAPATLTSLARQEGSGYLFTVNLKIENHD